MVEAAFQSGHMPSPQRVQVENSVACQPTVQGLSKFFTLLTKLYGCLVKRPLNYRSPRVGTEIAASILFSMLIKEEK